MTGTTPDHGPSAPRRAAEKARSNLRSKQWLLPLSKKVCFRLNPWITLAYLVVCAVMLRLGLWQLDRRDIKLTHNSEVSQFLAQQSEPLTYAAALAAFQQFNRQASDVVVSVSGQFLPNPIIFHDNRVHNMQAGLHALAFFKSNMESEPLLLINLGWLPWPGAGRPHLPQLTLPTSEVTLEGALFAPNPEIWSLEQVPPPPTAAGWLVQKLDLSALCQHPLATEHEAGLAKFTLRLKEASGQLINHQNGADAESAMAQPHYPIQSFAATTDWAMPPEKHLGYAVQWFAMVTVLSGLFFGLNIQRRAAGTDKTLQPD